MSAKPGRWMLGHEIIADLAARIAESSLRQQARTFGVSPAYLSDVMHHKRSVGPKLCRALGLERQRLVTVTEMFRKRGASA